MSYVEPRLPHDPLLVEKGGARPAGMTFVSGRPTGAARTDAEPKPRNGARAKRNGGTHDPDWTLAFSKRPTKPKRAAGGEPPPSRLTMRLDRDRHQRLKLTAAHLDMSLQDLLATAVDTYLNAVGPEVFNGGRGGNGISMRAAGRGRTLSR